MTTLSIDKQIDFAYLVGGATQSSYVRSWNKNLAAPYTVLSTSMFSSASNAMAFLEAKHVTVEDPAKIESFLTNYYGVVAYLFDVPEKVSKYFGDAQLKLGLFSDPDSPEDQSELYLEVETSLSPEEANEKLHQINHQWLLTSNETDLSVLNITLKFS